MTAISADVTGSDGARRKQAQLQSVARDGLRTAADLAPDVLARGPRPRRPGPRPRGTRPGPRTRPEPESEEPDPDDPDPEPEEPDPDDPDPEPEEPDPGDSDPEPEPDPEEPEASDFEAPESLPPLPAPSRLGAGRRPRPGCRSCRTRCP